MLSELLCGRISAGSICDNLNEEVLFISNYFKKLHKYRTEGSSLPDSGFVFCDTDFYNNNKFMATKINKFVKNLDSYFDIATTNKEALLRALEKGAQIGVLMVHSYADSFEILSVQDSKGESNPTYEAFALDELNKLDSKVHYLTLFACEACDYTKPNIGATLLFNNEYVLNIFGGTGNIGIFTHRRHYQELASGMPIGFSTRLYLQRMPELNENSPATIVALGDPTLVYKLDRGEAPAPIISSSLNNISAETGDKLVLPIAVYSPGSEITDVHINELPEGAVFDKESATMTWVPSMAQEGNIFYLEAVVTNESKKTSSGNFSITVLKNRELLSGKNSAFESSAYGIPNGWKMPSNQMIRDSEEKLEGKYSGRIDFNGTHFILSAYSGKIPVKENTKYLVTGYVKIKNQKDSDYIRMEVVSGKSESMSKFETLFQNSYSYGDGIKCGTGWVRISYIISTRPGEDTLRFGISAFNYSRSEDIKVWLDKFEIDEL